MSSRRSWVLGVFLVALLSSVLVSTLALRGGDRSEPRAPEVAAERLPEEGTPPPIPAARSAIDRPEPVAPTASPPAETPPERAGSPWHLPKGKLLVTVLDPWRRPVGSVAVRAFTADATRRKVGHATGRGERVPIFVPRGVALRIEASCEPLFHDGVEEPVLAEAGQVAISLQLKGARVSGRIVAAESGAPVPHAVFDYTRDGPHYVRSHSSRVAADGTFDLVVPSGGAHLTAGAPGRETVDWREMLREGEWRDGLLVALVRGVACSLSGRVVDEDGRLVPGARVLVRALPREDRISWIPDPLEGPREFLADGEGRFKVEDADVGKHRLLVTASGFESAGPDTVVFARGENEATIVLARAGRLRVRGVLPDGSPLLEGQIVLQRAGRIVGSATLHRAGIVSPGFSGRSMRARIEGIRVLERQETGEIDGRRLSGPDEHGYHTIEGIAWGEYEVLALAGPLEGRAGVALRAGETTSVEIPLFAKK
ncbi:MAG: carboxypeptidase regulatory-like domain-containing protein [Planctomycetes bacterium]|nr:carboxypeptidase regulatory-like domain-containing protein [Planctomycetota bacterium]